MGGGGGGGGGILDRLDARRRRRRRRLRFMGNSKKSTAARRAAAVCVLTRPATKGRVGRRTGESVLDIVTHRTHRRRRETEKSRTAARSRGRPGSGKAGRQRRSPRAVAAAAWSPAGCAPAQGRQWSALPMGTSGQSRGGAGSESEMARWVGKDGEGRDHGVRRQGSVKRRGAGEEL